MKLRVRGNSIRLRLSQTEVERIGRQEAVAESVAFGPEQDVQLQYMVVVSPMAEAVRARYTPGRITVEVPASVALDWALTDATSIEAHQPVSPTASLHITIEKDFKCLRPRAEDDEDAFPHPRTGEDVC